MIIKCIVMWEGLEGSGNDNFSEAKGIYYGRFQPYIVSNAWLACGEVRTWHGRAGKITENNSKKMVNSLNFEFTDRKQLLYTTTYIHDT